MAAKYTCNVCGRKLSGPCYKFHEHEFIDNDIRVCFIVDFNQRTANDICRFCAWEAINTAAKKIKEEDK